MTRFRTAVIGPGRVGSTVARALVRGGHRVVAATDGGGGSARALAEQVAGCRVAADAVTAVADADLVLVTVPDDRIEDVVTAVARADGWRPQHRVVHCSGARGMQPLRLASLAGAGTAACHPAQTVPADADVDVLLGVPWAVTCEPGDLDWAEEVVRATGGDPFALAEESRALYHAGLAVGSNAVAAATAVARQLLLAAGVTHVERVLAPLATASARNVARDGASALTGPVVRGDSGTVEGHLEALDLDLPRLAQAYRALQGVVLDQVAATLEAPARDRLTALLAADREAPPCND